MKIVGKKDIKADSAFAEEIAKRSGENVFLCYQCRKCASGCPSRQFMDKTPTELMRYAQLGMVDEAMKGNTIWYCQPTLCDMTLQQLDRIPWAAKQLRVYRPLVFVLKMRCRGQIPCPFFLLFDYR